MPTNPTPVEPVEALAERWIEAIAGQPRGLRLGLAYQTIRGVAALPSEREAKLTAEIEQLKASTLTPNMLADALECFWNASIGEAHNAQDSTTFSTVGAFAAGFAAVANRLREHAQTLGGSDEA